METYVVGFKIFDGKALQTEDGCQCDPFVIVECCGHEFQTAILEGKQQLASFNAECTWPDVVMHPKQFDSAYIEFKVFARNWFTRNYVIGKASLQLSFVNKRANCLYARKWVCLRRDEDPSITGMLNVTVFALQPGQQAPSATLQEQEQVETNHDGAAVAQNDEEQLSKAVLKNSVEAPPGKANHVEINVHRVMDLPTEASMGGEWLPSPYVTVEFAGVVLKTPVTENVSNFTLNTQLTIPVVTPLYEDTIILKLWNHHRFSPDELMAQGLISFSELRNNSLPPRWFNLYGWNKLEVPEMEQFAQAGITPEPNYFRGRLLVSGRVDPLESEEDLQPASVGQARGVPEPNVNYVCLLSDVYMVVGADGRNCEVEVSFGHDANLTAKVPCTYENHGNMPAPQEDEDGVPQEEVQVSTFVFNQTKGRINPILVMTPEESVSQPYILINVYTDTWVSGRRRIGYCMKKLKDFPMYEPGNPSKPRFYPVTPMPGQSETSGSASVLIAIERSPTEDLVRHTRKMVKPMMYIVRTYVFMARRIEHHGSQSERFALRVSCAGRSRDTQTLPGPRPRWMKHMDLQVTLYSDSAKEPPVIEPIQLTLLQRGKNNKELGKAICVYTHMRQKDNLGHWEPYVLSPQWTKVKGGSFGDDNVGELLIAFEILLYRHREEPMLRPQEMWPQPEHKFEKKKHFCKLRKATLHFSLHGLRDLLSVAAVESLNLGTAEICKPVVEVEVQWGDTDEVSDQADTTAGDASSKKRPSKLVFHYLDVIEGGDRRSKSDRLNCWKSWVGPACDKLASNFEILQVQKLQVEIPDKMILQPYVIVRLYEEPSRLPEWGTNLLGYSRKLIGECRRSLAEKLPVCWLEGVNVNHSLVEQEAVIRKAFQKDEDDAALHDEFQQPSADDLKALRRRYREDDDEVGATGSLQVALKAQLEGPKEYINSTGLPEPLRMHGKRRPLGIKAVQDINAEVAKDITPREGEKIQVTGHKQVKTIQGKLEDNYCASFNNDLWFKNAPLLLNHDIVGENDPTEWHYTPHVFGFVKCAFKLVDGWGDEPRTEDDAAEGRKKTGEKASAPAQTAVAAVAVGQTAGPPTHEAAALTVGEHPRVRRSHGLSDELDAFAFDEKKLRKRFKDPENLPSRVRIRLYVVKAVCIFGKGASDFPDPYLEFQLGRDTRVSMRSSAQVGNNEPDFYMLEERDVVLPDDAKLEVRVMDKANALEALTANDTLIGSTILDLEDRWHSKNWRHLNDRQEVPRENRPLCTGEVPGKNRGSIEMWVEMIESQKAADLKASPIVKPPELELEMRLVIWDATNVKLVADDTVNVQIRTSLDCREYNGEHKRVQETDVHYTSKDGNAIFNWRMVYPKIKMPVKTCSIQMDLLHYELLGCTHIGSLNLDLKKYVERVAANTDAIEIGPDLLKFSGPEADENEVPEEIGSATVSLYVMTQGEATSKKAGIGREDPNDFPPLITPAEGRDWGTYMAGFGLSMPDFGGMWKKLIPLFIAMVVFLALIIAMKNLGLLG